MIDINLLYLRVGCELDRSYKLLGELTPKEKKRHVRLGHVYEFLRDIREKGYYHDRYRSMG